MQNTILCVKWGDKYGNEYVPKEKLDIIYNITYKYSCFISI